MQIDLRGVQKNLYSSSYRELDLSQETVDETNSVHIRIYSHFAINDSENNLFLLPKYCLSDLRYA